MGAEKRLRVAIVHPYPWPEVRRGAERYLDDLATYLAAHGHDVTVITGTHGAPGEGDATGGYHSVQVPHRRVRGARRLGLGEVELFGLSAFAAVARSRADLVHAFVPSAALSAALGRRRTLYTVLGHPTADQLPHQRMARSLFTSAVRRSTMVAALSRASADALEQSAGRAATVLPPGVRTADFAPELAPRTGPPTVLFSGSLEDGRKGAALALSALGELVGRGRDVRLVLSGQGDPAPLLAALPAEVRAAVETPGPGRPDEVPDRYRRATVTCLPAAHEAFGLALVESLACGTPVVCTPAGGMPEIVAPGVGAIAASADAGALADALETAIELAGEPGTPPRCVERARRWDWDETVGPAHLETYRAVLSGRPDRTADSAAVDRPNAVPANRTTIDTTPNS